MVIAEEGCYTPEGSGFTLNIPNGIELHGAFSMWAAAGVWNVGGMVAVGDKAYVGNDSGTSYVRTPLTVSEGATLTMGGGHTTYYMETVTNRGEITVADGNHYIYGDLVNEGNPVIRTGRTMYIYPPLVQGDSRLVISGGQPYTSGRSDWGDAALDISLTGGGSFVIGTNNDGYGMPKFGKNKLSITAASGHSGTVYFHPSTSASIDGLTCSGTISKFFMQGPSSSAKGKGPIIDGHANDIVFTANNLEVGNGNGRGEWTITGENSHISVKGLYANWIGSHYYAGSLTFKEGLLEVGADGIKEAWTDPMRTVFNMENGTLRAADSFNIGKAGMTATFGSPVKGGAVTFDLNGKTVKWGTGLAGASDVTLTGAGSFAPDRAGIQGIPLGKWTIDTTSAVDLRNAAGFAGGLTLAENANATLDIAGDTMVEFVAWTWHDNAWDIMKPVFTAGQTMSSHVATSLTYFNRPASKIVDVKYGNGSGFNYFGEFYVSAEQVGTWYFAQRNQTHFGIHIDGTELSRLGPNKGGIYNINLTEGWHKFMVSIYTGEANQTIGPMTDSGDVAAQNGIWFKVGGSGNGSWPRADAHAPAPRRAHEREMAQVHQPREQPRHLRHDRREQVRGHRHRYEFAPDHAREVLFGHERAPRRRVHALRRLLQGRTRAGGLLDLPGQLRRPDFARRGRPPPVQGHGQLRHGERKHVAARRLAQVRHPHRRQFLLHERWHRRWPDRCGRQRLRT